MAWTYPQVKTAYLALSPTPATTADAATVLNAQRASTLSDVPVGSVFTVLGLSGSLVTLMSFATSPPSGAATAAVQAATSLLFAFEHSTLAPVFQMSNATVAAAMQTELQALVTAGVITTADQTAILALAQAPMWQPPLTAADVAAAIA